MSAHGAPHRHREWKLGCKVYIGHLAEGASKQDIESAFGNYGPLRNVWVARNPPGFAFVEFEDGRDAEDACRNLDGTMIAGVRIKAEMSHGRTRRGRGGPPGLRGPGGYTPTYPGGSPYGYGGGSGGRHYGSQSRGSHYNGGDYYNPTVGHHYRGPRSGPSGGHHSHHHHQIHTSHHGGYGHIDRSHARERHVPRLRSPVDDARDGRFSRSRSDSLENSALPLSQMQQNHQEQQQSRQESEQQHSQPQPPQPATPPTEA